LGKRIPTRQLAAISLLAATAAASRIGVNWTAFTVPIPVYGIVVKIGLTETLTFVSGFVFGPIQGFITGALAIIVSDLLTWPGIWTLIIAAIIGLLGILGGLFRRLGPNPSIISLGAAAVVLTMISESFQNIYTAWSYLISGMSLTESLILSFGGGIVPMVTALVNNTVLFTMVAPRIIMVIRRTVITDPKGGLIGESREESARYHQSP
jgi:energy-coupling factor transport system substrate-specific component